MTVDNAATRSTVSTTHPPKVRPGEHRMAGMQGQVAFSGGIAMLPSPPVTTSSSSPKKVSAATQTAIPTRQYLPLSDEENPPPAHANKDFASAFADMQGSIGLASAPVVPDMTRKPSTPTSSSSSPPTKRFLSMFSKSKSDNQPNQPKPFNAGPGNSPRDRQKAAEVDCPTSQGAKS